MSPVFHSILLLSLLQCLMAQQFQIWDIWQTKWDRTNLFTSLKPSPIPFGAPSVIGSADIDIDETSTFQSVYGFGGSLTDSSALLLNNLKTKNSANYWKLIKYLFSAVDGANAAGLSYLRIPLGASDFSANTYSFDDTSGDTSFSKFNINRAPSYLFSVAKDIYSVNSGLHVHIVPWSPPGWMKDTGTMTGGTLKPELLDTYATYLLKAAQGFRSKGLPVYAMSIQNEPMYSNPTYPTSKLTPAQEGQIGKKLRSLLNSNGLSTVKIIGYDHNWSSAASYPVQLMDAASSAFNGVAFHCYGGTVQEQDAFHAKYPTKGIYFTECSGTLGSDWWSDIKWYLDNISIGSVEHGASSGLMWNLALDGSGNPKLPTTSSCGGPGCRGIVQINSDGTYSVNQEFYALAHASKATIPKDVGGPVGKRIGVTVGGQLNWALRVGAFVTERKSASDWLRYSIVVLNWNDNADGSWKPVPVLTTIEFRGQQATYTFPVGVTTLWWYAPKSSSLNSTTTTVFDDAGGVAVQFDSNAQVYLEGPR